MPKTKDLEPTPNSENGTEQAVNLRAAGPMDAEQKNSVVSKSKYLRFLYLFLGTLSLLLGIIGIVLPGLPTTPFILLAGVLYSRGSRRIYNWLLTHKYFGKKIREYKQHKGIPKPAKIKILLLMLVMISISTFLMLDSLNLRIIVWAAGAIGALVVVFLVPTSKR